MTCMEKVTFSARVGENGKLENVVKVIGGDRP
jgi:hypothetical protein